MKLTNAIREEITNAVIKYRFEKEYIQLMDDIQQAANKVYEDFYEKELKKINALPKGWLPTGNGIKAKFGSEVIEFSFNGGFSSRTAGLQSILQKRESIYFRFLHDDRDCYKILKVYDDDHNLSKICQKAHNNAKEFVRNVQEAERQIQAALASCSTLAKLEKVWAEVKPFTEKYKNKDTVNLPAIPVARLNGIFNLPVKKGADVCK